jgi:hypothetical protein
METEEVQMELHRYQMLLQDEEAKIARYKVPLRTNLSCYCIVFSSI